MPDAKEPVEPTAPAATSSAALASEAHSAPAAEAFQPDTGSPVASSAEEAPPSPLPKPAACDFEAFPSTQEVDAVFRRLRSDRGRSVERRRKSSSAARPTSGDANNSRHRGGMHRLPQSNERQSQRRRAASDARPQRSPLAGIGLRDRAARACVTAALQAYWRIRILFGQVKRSRLIGPVQRRPASVHEGRARLGVIAAMAGSRCLPQRRHL